MSRVTGSALAIAAALAAGCGDEPLAPTDETPPADVSQPLELSEENQASLREAFRFAGEQSVRGLQQTGSAQLVATAFATLAGHIEANDRAGTERATMAARLAISRYRDLADDGAAAADLEAMDLTLARATDLMREASRRPPIITNKEHQP